MKRFTDFVDRLQGKDQTPLWQLIRLGISAFAIVSLSLFWIAPRLISARSDIAVLLGMALVIATLCTIVALAMRAIPLFKKLDEETKNEIE